MAHEEWVKLYARKLDGLPVRCPECTADAIEWWLVGDLETRMGFGVIYCARCRLGCRLSRVRFPPHVSFVPLGSEAGTGPAGIRLVG